MDTPGIVREGVQLLGREHVPQTDRAGLARRRQDSAVGGKCQRAQNPHFIARAGRAARPLSRPRA